MRWLQWLVLIVIAGSFLALPIPVDAQYFGRNKVTYQTFDFQEKKTENFRIFYYPEKERAVQDAALMAERWYERHRQTFAHSFDERKPLIFYANDADFMQTNVVDQFIDQATGGLAEPLRERVVMPFTGDYAQFDQVLGHELVHSFQYDLTFDPDENVNIQELPLWVVEGMAEYQSIGRHHPHTAMWMRDAVVRDDLPSFGDLANEQQYFPYRFGHAFLAYIGGKHGDAALPNLFRLGGQGNLDAAVDSLFNISGDSLATEWHEATRNAYEPLLEDRTPADEAGERILAPEIDGGNINIAPSLSPDGRWVAFLSERDLFSINLFVADAETGEVVADLGNAGTTPHFDNLRFLESAGSWSPDGDRLAFATFAEGDNEIAIWNVESDEIETSIAIDGVPALRNPSWSPDGSRIVFSGIHGGLSDLYVLDLETEEVEQLTNDRYAYMMPSWSPNGETLVFMTDRGVTDLETLDASSNLQIGRIDVATGEMTLDAPFEGAQHHNPQYAPDGQSLYFVSDQDGFRDLYRWELTSDDLHRVTDLKTGVSGITALAPAMSVARQSGDIMFSVFSGGNYTGVALDPDEADGTPIDETEIAATDPEAAPRAGTLPPHEAFGEGIVATYLDDPTVGLPTDPEFETDDYDPTLSLETIMPPRGGVSVGGPFGTQFVGGVGFRFGDMLGDQRLNVIVQAQGEIQDIGGQVGYTNRGSRINYSAVAGHQTQRFSSVAFEEIDGTTVINQIIWRTFITEAGGGAQYPLDMTRRFEVSGGITRYGFGTDVRSFLPDGQIIDRDDDLVDSPDSRVLGRASWAYVEDYSLFGMTSPVQGGRQRLEIGPRLGTEQFVTARADIRRYYRADPVTFAFKGLHVGNYGASPGDQFARQFVGLPYQQGFVRGYNVRSFDPEECSDPSCPEVNQLVGTRVAKASAELRVPLLGPAQISLIPFPFVPTELSLFADAGMTWTSEDLTSLTFDQQPTSGFFGAGQQTGQPVGQESIRAQPVWSAGVSARFNVLGALVLETYWAYPFQREVGGQWGLRFLPGW